MDSPTLTLNTRAKARSEGETHARLSGRAPIGRRPGLFEDLRKQALALAVCAHALACGTGEESPPNVLMIVVDTLRADHLGCYGYERNTTPHIDALAAESIRYASAMSQSSWTSPSIGSLFTSMYPSALGMADERSPLPMECATLSEVLRERGYSTAAVVSHDFCSSRWNFDQGFDRFDESNVRGHDAVTSDLVAARGCELLAGLSEPFFLWLHFFDPHFAYIEHEGFSFPRAAQYEGPVHTGMPFPDLVRLRRSLSDADAEELRRLYDSEIAFTDHWIGKVLSRLDELDLSERTVVVLTSDHGEEFLDHARLGHAKTLYQEVVHVPLIARFPGTKPAVVKDPVGLIDVMPTIFDVLGMEAYEAHEGISIHPSRLGGLPSERPIFSETSKGRPLRAVRMERFKLVENLDQDEWEWFDLVADARELEPQETEGAKIQPLRDALDQFGDLTRRPRYSAEPLQLSPEETRRLKALGYLPGK